MNDFIRELNPVASFRIQKDSSITAGSLETEVEKNIPDKTIDESFNLVYIYYLDDDKFTYPCGVSNVLYIGKTNGQKKGDKKSAAFRFVHLKDGKDCKQNITLGGYYKKGKTIGLDIYEVDDCKKKEKELRYKFLNEYGALPVADGAAYSNDKFVTRSVDEEIDEQIN